MSTYHIQKLSRGEYQVIRPDGSNYFAYPTTKHKAERAILTEKVHARFLLDAGIKKAVQRFIARMDIRIDTFCTVDTLVYQYSYQLDHGQMRAMMKKPKLFTEHIAKVMDSDKVARLASIAPETVDTLPEIVLTLQQDVARLKQQIEYLNNRVNQ